MEQIIIFLFVYIIKSKFLCSWLFHSLHKLLAWREEQGVGKSGFLRTSNTIQRSNSQSRRINRLKLIHTNWLRLLHLFRFTHYTAMSRKRHLDRIQRTFGDFWRTGTLQFHIFVGVLKFKNFAFYVLLIARSVQRPEIVHLQGAMPKWRI